MPITRSRDQVAAYALSLSGKSRDHLPVPWTNSAAIDDCARFTSHCIWLGNPGPISWVDNYKTAGDGSYRAGAADLQPWDVLLFDWEGNGVGNHVEFFISDNGNGTVQTYGANGSDTRAAKYRTRPKHYIMGGFRPRWAAAAAAPLVHTTTTTTTRKDDDDAMQTILNKATGDYFLVGKEYVHHLGSKKDATLVRNVFSVVDEVHELTGPQTNTIFAALNIPQKYTKAATLVREHPDGVWSLSAALAAKAGA